MYCCLSGTIASNPVVNRKDGRLYDQSIILAYIDSKGTDPFDPSTNLSKEDLITVINHSFNTYEDKELSLYTPLTNEPESNTSQLHKHGRDKDSIDPLALLDISTLTIPNTLSLLEKQFNAIALKHYYTQKLLKTKDQEISELKHKLEVALATKDSAKV